MVKYLYDEEKQKNGAIQTLSEFRESFRVPFEGFAYQVGPANGIHGNLGVEKLFGFSAKVANYTDEIHFCFRLPEFLDEQSLEFYLGGELAGTYTPENGRIMGNVKVAESEEAQRFEFRFKNSKSPFEADVASDRRKYAAFIDSMSFLPKQVARRRKLMSFLKR